MRNSKTELVLAQIVRLNYKPTVTLQRYSGIRKSTHIKGTNKLNFRISRINQPISEHETLLN